MDRILCGSFPYFFMNWYYMVKAAVPAVESSSSLARVIRMRIITGRPSPCESPRMVSYSPGGNKPARHPIRRISAGGGSLWRSR